MGVLWLNNLQNLAYQYGTNARKPDLRLCSLVSKTYPY